MSEVEKQQAPESTVEKSNLIVYAAIICVVLFIVYKLYSKLSDDTDSDDDTSELSDFNLRESIAELQKIQQRVISKLSSTSDI